MNNLISGAHQKHVSFCGVAATTQGVNRLSNFFGGRFKGHGVPVVGHQGSGQITIIPKPELSLFWEDSPTIHYLLG